MWDNIEKAQIILLKHISLFIFLISPAGIQYTPVLTDVTFNAGISTRTVNIPILDNGVVAESMLFSVVLTSADPAVVLHPETADVTIEDDDCELPSCKCVPDFTIHHQILSAFSGHIWIESSKLFSG